MRIRKPWQFAGSITLSVFILIQTFALPSNQINHVNYGITFSKYRAKTLGLDWKKAYQETLKLGFKSIRLPVYWNDIQKRQDFPRSDLAELEVGPLLKNWTSENTKYDFKDLDWQIKNLKPNQTFILAIGQKVPRWPECFNPDWINDPPSPGFGETSRQKELLDFMAHIVRRYRKNPALLYWQVENEPRVPFGTCPPFDENLFNQEIALVKKIDPNHPILTTDSGERSFWFSQYKKADVFGNTLYQKVWHRWFGDYTFPFTPGFYRFKKRLVNRFAGDKKIINVELQGEPWGPKDLNEMSIAEQINYFSLNDLKNNILFSQKAEYDTTYLWGIEWWIYLEKNEHPEFIDYISKLASSN